MNGTTAVAVVAVVCASWLGFALLYVIRVLVAPPAPAPDIEEQVGVPAWEPAMRTPEWEDPTERDFPSDYRDKGSIMPVGADLRQYLGIGDEEMGPIMQNPTDFAGIDLAGEES